MKFIFPQNYDTSSKFLGVIDYSTAIINIVWIAFVFFLSAIFTSSLLYRICFSIALSIPVLIFSIVGFNNENIVYVLIYIIKFYFHPKIYIYKKQLFYVDKEQS